MPFRSALLKILVTVLGIAIVLVVVDILLFQSLNTTALVNAILTMFSVNPILSWGLIIFLIAIISLIGTALFYRRRLFIQNLKDELEAAERITLIELAQKLEVTPAKIEVELNRMAGSKMTKFPGLIIISQGKHVYLGEKNLIKIVDLYNDGNTRGEIANSLQISRTELDKAVTYLLEKGEIEEREEETIRKVRPSYRRGTR